MLKDEKDILQDEIEFLWSTLAVRQGVHIYKHRPYYFYLLQAAKDYYDEQQIVYHITDLERATYIFRADFGGQHGEINTLN